MRTFILICLWPFEQLIAALLYILEDPDERKWREWRAEMKRRR